MNLKLLAEQVIARIGGPAGGGTSDKLELLDIVRMRREPRVYEKNWAPFVDNGAIRFMYRPGHVVNDTGQDISKVDPPFAVGHFAGSGGLIKILGYWMGIIHEARYHLGTPHRYYQHRFMLYDEKDYRVRAISKPFVFNDKVIEFAAGLAHHPKENKIVISYGWKDCEARIATVKLSEVMEFIWHEGQRSE